MSTETNPDGGGGAAVGGAIGWMARNTVAANLLMIVILVGGIFGLFRVKQEVFPSFDLDIVSVTVPYPGASPSEVEQGIVLVLEEELRGVDGVKRVTATAGEGFGQARAELLVGANHQQALADIKSAVDRISSFPEEAEEPSVSLISRRRQVISLVVAGDQDERTLHQVAEQVRERLLATEGVTQVELEGVRPLEVAIEIPQQTLEAYGLTLEQVAAQVRASSLELPGGALKTDGGEILVRVADRRLEGHEFSDIVLRGTAAGSQVRLGDIATITDGYADVDLFNYFNGKPAVRVVAYRVGDETPRGVADVTKALAEELRAELPPNLEIAVWADDSAMLDARIELLLENAQLGLVLVLLVLTLFLDIRLAFWVGLGIPVSILGAFALMPVADVSVNMVSLFAFIITLGIVVDDAIVVGENIYDLEKAGMGRLQASIEGAKQMLMPVTFSLLTTVVAFAPMLGVPGVMGKIFRILPILVTLVLTISFIESFFVLPSHLGHSSSLLDVLTRWTDPVRKVVERGFEHVRTVWYRPVTERLMEYRYTTLAGAFVVFLVTMGSVAAGMVPFNFFPKLEGDIVTASARLPYGTPIERTLRVQRALEEAAMASVEQSGGTAIFRGMYTSVGSGPSAGNGLREEGGHLVTVELQLVSSDLRDVTSQQLADAWASGMPPLAGVESLVFSSSTGPGAGAAVDVMVSHPDTAVLEAASADVFQALKSFPVLTDHENTFASGKPQLDFHLLPSAATLGLTANDVARQIRSAYFGAEALREQRGRNELKVMVRLPEEQRQSEYHLERLLVRAPNGGMVPLSHVARFDRGRAPTTITREDGRRVVNVKAELRPSAPSAREVLTSLEDEAFPQLREKYPGLEIGFAGQQREQAEVFGSLLANFGLAAVLMYAMLAIPFKSYIQPVIVMMAIPMGFVGAIGGHVLMGYELSLISVFGLIALAGVVVNSSLVLIDATNQYRAEGMSAWDAVIQGGSRRLRPILLTSLTTFFGLAPMILETSVQARFLIPMALSLGYGILFTTVAIPLLIPPFYMIVEDVTGLLSRVFRASPVPNKASTGLSSPSGLAGASRIGESRSSH